MEDVDNISPIALPGLLVDGHCARRLIEQTLDGRSAMPLPWGRCPHNSERSLRK